MAEPLRDKTSPSQYHINLY